MKQFRLRKGLDLPVEGKPEQSIVDGPAIKTVAALGSDYLGLKPRLSVQEGDVIGAGAPLFAHKDTPSVFVTAPISGRVAAVNRGYRRALVSVEIEADEAAPAPVDFSQVGDSDTREGIREKLCASGLWTSFRTRPYSKVPAPETEPAAIFINAMETEPLAAEPSLIIDESADDFAKGVQAISALTDGTTYLCCHVGHDIPGQDLGGVETAAFSGPHPAGLSGTHIHFLEPPTAQRTVWTIGYQDVIAIGRLIMTGTLNAERVIALAGPLVHEPRLIRTVMGASLSELTNAQYDMSVPTRIISGSILSGASPSEQAAAYLGRYARQISVIEEDKQQNPFGWIRPMAHKFAFQPVLGSALSRKSYPLTSNLNGGRRAMVPLGTFEELMPQDYLPTQLLRALLVMDTDVAQSLGALELDEEDLSLVGFACPAKYEYGVALRDCLNKIEKEG
ncbi:MAG: Na(+)-translocating NADH-quinone reductase subunit A [Pseudomonadota bacterium]